MKTEQLEQTELTYEAYGFVAETIAMFISLIVGIVIVTVVVIFGGTLSGQVYNNIETDLLALNTTNSTYYGYVQTGIISGFESFETSAGYTPTIVLAIVIFLVLGLILSLGFSFGFGGAASRGASGGVL